MSQEYLNIDYSKSLDQQPYKELYARLTSLTHDELPLETFEGIVTTGNINVDGNAALRRTCNLNITAAPENTVITEAYWALTHKFKLEIGIRSNDANMENTEIEWFKQGVYVISSFSHTKGISSQNISISGQDKMCNLNGALGGSFPHEIDFGTVETEQVDGSILIEQVEIKDIITQSVSQYGKEPLHNIIINDLPEHGLELLTYRGNTPLYLIAKLNSDNKMITEIISTTFDEDTEVYILAGEYSLEADVTGDGIVDNLDEELLRNYLDGHEGAFLAEGTGDLDKDGMINSRDLGLLQQRLTNPQPQAISLANIRQYWSLNTIDPSYNNNATKISLSAEDVDMHYCVVQINFGDTIGYRKTPLIYAGNLICKAGETVMSLLDKIKNMLGEFEYFYDIDGHFVFQKKKTYLSELFSPANGDIINPLVINMPYSYTFQDTKMITSISTNPAINKLKNDFVFWGTRKGATGGSINIHTRCAIDKKPTSYTSAWGKYEQLQNLFMLYKCQKIDDYYYFNKHNGIVYASTSLNNQNVFAYNGDEKIYFQNDYGDISNQGTFFIKTDNQPFDFTTAETIGGANIKIVQPIKNDSNVLEKVNILSGDYYYFDQTKISEDHGGYIPIPKHKLDEQTGEITEIPVVIKNYKSLYVQVEANQIYTNTEYDWREIIYRMAEDYMNHNQENDFAQKIATANIINNNQTLYPNGVTQYEQYYADLYGFWRLLYNPNDDINCFPEGHAHQYWNKQVYLEPQTLIFWFDFLDVGEAELSKYSVRNIGMRPKVANSTAKSHTSIFINNTPDIIFVDNITDAPKDQEGYSYVQLPQNIDRLMSTSVQNISLIEDINSAIYNEAIITETVSLAIVPIYHLQPNTRIYVEGIGDLIINKIACPIGHSGTMTLTCQKPLPRIY